MKSDWLPGLALLSLIACAPTQARAQDDWVVETDVEMAAIEPSTALSLVPRLGSPATFVAGAAELKQLIAEGRAELLGWPRVTLDNGSTGASSSGEVIEFPSEQIFASMPQPPPASAAGVPKPPIPRQRNWGAITPWIEQSRKSGPSLQVEATMFDDGKRIWVRGDAHFVTFLRFKDFFGAKDLWGIAGVAQRPEFADAHVLVAVSLRDGQSALLGTFLEHEPKPRLIVFIIHAAARNAKPVSK
jgi:hypothetical protein